MYYGYTDRIQLVWQIAVDMDSEKSKYKIGYPLRQLDGYSEDGDIEICIRK